MTQSATLTRIDMSPEMAELLRAGAADQLGLCCSPGRVEKNYAALRECERRGYLRWINIEKPWITPAGRAAIGAPTEAEADRARRIAVFGAVKRLPLQPAKRDDPRTDFDYRSFQNMGWVCVLVIKQPDYRQNAVTLRVGKTLSSPPQFLGPRNSIVQPESEGRFALAIVPKWLSGVAGFSSYPMPLDESDPEWTDDERATWDRLRSACFCINARIRSAGRKQREKLRFGENA